MTDFITLQNRIANDVYQTALASSLSGGLTQDQVKNAILRAIKHYEREEYWFNTKTGTFTAKADQEYYDATDLADIPNLINVYSMTVNIAGIKEPIYSLPFDRIDGVQTSVIRAYPEFFAYYNQQIRFLPIPEQDYPILITYTYRLTTLSADGDSNEWTDDAEELIYQRAAADIRINTLREVEAKAERAGLASQGKDFLSLMEEPEHRVLKRETIKRRSNKRLRVDPALVNPDRFNIHYQ